MSKGSGKEQPRSNPPITPPNSVSGVDEKGADDLSDNSVNDGRARTAILPIASLTLDEGIQVRVALSEKDVRGYAKLIASGHTFDPVAVFHDGASYWLSDGFHRVRAAERNGQEQIEALVHPGGREDALKHALQVNVRHGVRLTRADKRRAVELALRGWPAQSDRQIAEFCGVHHQLVSTLRGQLDESSSSKTRVGKDGKTRRLPTPKASTRSPQLRSPALENSSSHLSPTIQSTLTSNEAHEPYATPAPHNANNTSGAEATVDVDETPKFILKNGEPIFLATWPVGWMPVEEIRLNLETATIRDGGTDAHKKTQAEMALLQKAVFFYAMVACKLTGPNPDLAEFEILDEGLQIVRNIIGLRLLAKARRGTDAGTCDVVKHELAPSPQE